jgi:hypothetical protein
MVQINEPLGMIDWGNENHETSFEEAVYGRSQDNIA